MKNVKICLIFMVVSILLILFVHGSIIAIVDPFFLYHKPLDGLFYVIDNQLEQNPGMAKNFDYDSIILGSSMTTNFDTDVFGNQTGTEMIKLSYNAATPYDIGSILEVVKESGKDIEIVYLCIDIANYMSTPGKHPYAHPKHLEDQNPFNDLKYLLSKEVLFEYVLQSNLKKENTPVNEMYWHWQYMTYRKDIVLKNYELPDFETKTNTEDWMGDLGTNLETCIIPYIESMPDTKWHIFFPPYSMLYWYDSVAAGEAELKIDGMAYITQCLGQYDNVSIHYFQDIQEWVTDLNNYTDKTHFSKQVTDEMTDRLCDETEKVDMYSYKERLEMFKEFVMNFDYESFVKP